MGRISDKKILFIIIALAFAIRLAVALAPLDWLLARGILPDDAFYYFKIAENIAQGQGVSFDGIGQTNGFHPLWMILIAPIFFFVHQKILAVHIALIFSAVIGSLAVLIFHKILFKIDINRKIRLAATALFAFLPTFYLSGAGMMNGLETSINVFLILAYTLFFLKVYDGNSFIYFGIISGLLFLARTDNAILLITTWAFLLFKFINAGNWFGTKKIMIAGILAVLIISPWLAWSYSTFGEFIQVSGKAIPFVAHQKVILENWNFFDYSLKYLKNTADSLIYLFGIIIVSKESWEFLLFVVVGLLSLFAVLNFLKTENLYSEFKEKFLKKILIFSPFIITFFIFLLAQTLRVINFRAWYYFSVLPILFLALVIFADCIFVLATPKIKKLILIGGGICLTVISFTVVRFIAFPLAGGDISKYRMIQKLNTIIPENSIVGAWNAGVYGYFFEKGKIINLDGVVNNEVYPYIKNHNVKDYAKKVGINYLVDDSLTLENEYWGDTKPVDDIELTAKISDFKEGTIVAGYLKN